MQHLILGGVRSGKSGYAEQRAQLSQKEVIYIATGTVGDEEMRARINRHKEDRPRYWTTIEEPITLGCIIAKYDNPRYFLLVDCLTLWLSNILFDAQGHYQEDIFLQQKQALLSELARLHTDIVLVSNEVGLGITPIDKMSRQFIDEAGRLHQQLAKQCSHVSLVTAGLAQALKQ
jgi:adenosylcobinamide kinase/adenosylcobinamide-phosphate guanylyltransferase